MPERIEINTDNSVTVRLRNVRLSFPSLFTPTSFDGDEAKAKYGCQFLMAKTGDAAENAQLVKQGIEAVIKNAFKGKNPGSDKLCLRDGAQKSDLDGYGDDIVFMSASSKKPVLVVDKDLCPLNDKSGKPYAGCYVNATIRLWAQDNNYGKRVNAQLKAVQFHADGEPFGAGAADPEEEFADVTDSLDIL